MTEHHGDTHQANNLRRFTRRRVLGAAGVATGAVVAESLGRAAPASAATDSSGAFIAPYPGYMSSSTVTVPAGSSPATVTVDLAVADHWDITLSSNVQLALANAPAAATPVWIFVRAHQDSVGAWQMAFFPGTVWPIGVVPTLSSQPGAQDSFSFLLLNGVTTGYIAGQSES